MKTDHQTVTKQAKEISAKHNQPAWVYQIYEDLFIFRLSPLPKEERGLLVGIWLGDRCLSPNEAAAIRA